MNRLFGGPGYGAALILSFFLFTVFSTVSVPAEGRPVSKPPPVGDLAKFVEDGTQSDRVRLEAARGLAESSDPEALPPLFKVIRDPKEKGILRAAVVRTLVRSSKKEEVVPFLEERLADKEDPSDVRAAAAFVLGSLGGASSKPLLLSASTDSHPAVRQGARSALLTMGGEGVDQAGILIETLKDREQPGAVRALAARGLGEAKEARAFALLLEVLKEKAPEMPPPKNPGDFFAARAAAKGNVPADAARALGRLGDPDAELRVAVFEALAALKAREAVPAARKALSDTEQRVRRWAAVLLKEVGDREALPDLRQALSDPDPGVRLQAAQALGAMRDSEATEPLGKALAQETLKEVKEAINEALHAIKGASPERK